MRGFYVVKNPFVRFYPADSTVHWNPSIVDFFVKAKLSTIEGFSTNEGVLCGEKSICQA